MDPATLAAIADVGVSLLSRNKSANRANVLANYWATVNQQNFQREMMNEQNEYNKPVNQVKRLLEANLNPNLVYENGNAIIESASPSGGVSNVPNLVTPDRTKLDLLGKINTIAAMREQKARTDNIEANTNAVDVNMRMKEAQLGLQTSKTMAEINKLRVESGLAPLKAQKLIEEINWLSNKKQPFDWKNPNDWEEGITAGTSGIKRAVERIVDGDVDATTGGRGDIIYHSPLFGGITIRNK